jgi:hypothetical protein
MAVFGAVFGVAILIFGAFSITRAEDPNWPFLVLWFAAGVGIVGFNLWAAFGKSGRLYDIESDSSAK